MKTFDQILLDRRSVRRWDAQRTVTRNQIQQILRAAQEAPSWKNSQTARYHVALSPEAVASVRACLPERNQTTVAGAAALVVTTFVHGVAGFNHDHQPDNEIADGWGIYDLGLQNALLLAKAAELDIDSIVLGLRDAAALRTVLAIPADETVVAVIALGHRAADLDPQRPPRKDLADIATFA